MDSQGQAVPAGVWEALQRPSKNLKSSQLLSEFPTADDLIKTDPDGLVNKYALVCPRQECGSLILKEGAAAWVERASVQLEPADRAAHTLLPALPEPPQTMNWWLITPSPMSFENIGFSKPVQSNIASGPKMKLLACAECDLGPLGWSEEGGTEFWLACSRVRYRT
ncbi:Mss4-like protein [Infundibulicybe gibba]|nr:Mss4-like protein [Infundibulicybe gibba]